jgi:S-adenosylmethionine hydrolase
LARTAIITLTTDFGLNDHFIGAMKGVILGIAPEAQIIDISHAVQPFDILDGALTISQAYSYFPSGTVHMVIVDPGVGTARRPVILTGDRHMFVAPDNGVLSLIYDREERLSVRHVTAEHYFLQPRPKPVDERTLRGVVLKVDRFGNLITNITPQDAPQLFEATPPAFKIAIGNKGQASRMCTNYAEGAPGEVFGILGSMGFLEVAANRGSAFQLLGAGKGSEVNVVMEGRVMAGL